MTIATQVFNGDGEAPLFSLFCHRLHLLCYSLKLVQTPNVVLVRFIQEME